jgi:hypothetical protein
VCRLPTLVVDVRCGAKPEVSVLRHDVCFTPHKADINCRDCHVRFEPAAKKRTSGQSYFVSCSIPAQPSSGRCFKIMLSILAFFRG